MVWEFESQPRGVSNRDEFRLRIKEIRNEFENDRDDILDLNEGDDW